MSNKKLHAIIEIGGVVSGSLNSALGTVKGKIGDIGKEIGVLGRKQKLLSESIQVFGRQGKNIDGMRQRYVQLGDQMARLRKEQERLTKAQENWSRSKTISKNLVIGGVGTVIAGAGAAHILHSPVDHAKEYQTELVRIQALGLGAEQTKKAAEYAKDFKAFGVGQLDKLELMRDALGVFADEHHAQMAMPALTKMKFANKAVFGAEKGEEQTSKFQDMLKVIELRGGAKSSTQFNKEADMIQKVISATGGRVQADEWKKVIATGGLAAKGMPAADFYSLLEPIIQEKGGDQTGTGLMSAYSSLYQGRTTKRAAVNLDKLGLIGDKTKVKHDKSGQVSFMDPGALLGSYIFRRNQLEWIEKVFLPQMAKKGITDENKIVDTLGAIVSNRKGADFLATLYLQRQQIHKSMSLNQKSAGIDELTGQAKGTASGKELEQEAKLADLKLRLGTNVLPIYIKALELTATAFEKLNRFSERHPTIAKALMIGIAGVGAALAGVGSLMVGAGGVVWGFGMLAKAGSNVKGVFVKYPALLSKVGAAARILGSGVYGGALKLLSGLKWLGGGALWLGRILGYGVISTVMRLGGALRFVGTAVIWLGRALVANPIGAAIAVIATAAFLIYENWDKLKPYSVGLWDYIKGVFKSSIDWISEKIEWLSSKVDWIVGKAQAIGNTVSKAIDDTSNAASSAWNEVKKPENWAPSFTAGGTNGLPPLPSLAGGQGSHYTDNSQYSFHIYQQPGEDQNALAKRIADEQERRRKVQARSAMHDGATAQ